MGMLKNDINELYKKIVKIINDFSSFSFYDKATYIDDLLHYNKMCRELINDKLFIYVCKDKCKFTVVVNYREKTIEVSSLECT
jgi:hypothetical protein